MLQTEAVALHSVEPSIKLPQLNVKQRRFLFFFLVMNQSSKTYLIFFAFSQNMCSNLLVKCDLIRFK